MHSKTPAVKIPPNPKKVKNYFKEFQTIFQRQQKTPEYIHHRHIPGVFVRNKQKGERT